MVTMAPTCRRLASTAVQVHLTKGGLVGLVVLRSTLELRSSKNDVLGYVTSFEFFSSFRCVWHFMKISMQSFESLKFEPLHAWPHLRRSRSPGLRGASCQRCRRLQWRASEAVVTWKGQEPPVLASSLVIVLCWELMASSFTEGLTSEGSLLRLSSADLSIGLMLWKLLYSNLQWTHRARTGNSPDPWSTTFKRDLYSHPVWAISYVSREDEHIPHVAWKIS